MSGEKFITSSAEGADKEVTPATARALLGSSGRDFVTVAAAEAATYTEPEHCAVKETGKAYIYDAASTATVDHDYVLSVGDAVGRLIATHIAIKSLLDNSIADTLHRHSELVASDGSPDPAFSVDANGNAELVGGALTVTQPTTDLLGFGVNINQNTVFGAGETGKGFVLANTGTGDNFFFASNPSGTGDIGMSMLVQGVGGWTFGLDQSDGMKFKFSNNWSSLAGGSKFVLDFATGFAGFNQNSPTAQAHVKGTTADASTFITKGEDSTGKLLDSLRADGLKFHDGAIARPALTITADATLTVATRAFLLLNFAGTGGVVTLPASPEDGQEFHPENIGVFAVTLARNGKLINGAASNVSIGSQTNGYYKYDTASGSWWSFD